MYQHIPALAAGGRIGHENRNLHTVKSRSTPPPPPPPSSSSASLLLWSVDAGSIVVSSRLANRQRQRLFFRIYNDLHNVAGLYVGLINVHLIT